EDEAAETEAVAARPRRAGSRQLAAGIAEVGAGRLPTEVEGGLPAARSERTRGPGQSEQPAVLQALGEVLGRPRDVGARRRLGERRCPQAGAQESEGQPKGQPKPAHSCFLRTPCAWRSVLANSFARRQPAAGASQPRAILGGGPR